MMTTINTARRAFFKGTSTDIAHRMPWAVDAFEDACRRCSDCIDACEESILIAGDGGFPSADFARGACTFCAACVDACRYGALDRRADPPWRHGVVVGDDCLSASGVTCRACGDACEQGAIRFQLQTRGRALVAVDDARCNGCGGCIAVCPTSVIRVREAA